MIGAAGMLGREVVRAAEEAGHDVVPTAREVRAGWVRFDAERDPPEALFEGGRVELVVNCAAVLASEIDPSDTSTIRRAEALNARFPHALADAADAAGARLVHLSTDAVFPEDAGRAFEDDEPRPDSIYGTTKLAGEPDGRAALTIRCSFVGLDPARRRGLLEWLLAQPVGADLGGYVDHAWNGLVSTQVAGVVAAFADADVFTRARAEGAVHHLFEDPAISKHELLVLIARTFHAPMTVAACESGTPSTRVLGSRHHTLAGYLEWLPRRDEALEALSKRGADEHA